MGVSLQNNNGRTANFGRGEVGNSIEGSRSLAAGDSMDIVGEFDDTSLRQSHPNSLIN
jgi:hypothetical protein